MECFAQREFANQRHDTSPTVKSLGFCGAEKLQILKAPLDGKMQENRIRQQAFENSTLNPLTGQLLDNFTNNRDGFESLLCGATTRLI